MRFSKSTALPAVVAAAILFNGMAAAQNNTGSDSKQNRPAGSVMTHVVQVSDAKGSLEFFPGELTGVNSGDLVQFQFWPKSHSVAQSSFDKPCQPLQGGDVPAFWSGMMPVTAESTTMPIFTIMVNDTKPIWFYCATGRHCQNGMAGVINPPVGKTLAQYKAAAKSVEKTGVPEGLAGGSNGTASSGGSGGSSSGSSSAPSPTKTKGGGALQSGTAGAAAGLAIPAGKAIAALAAIAAGALALV